VDCALHVGEIAAIGAIERKKIDLKNKMSSLSSSSSTSSSSTVACFSLERVCLRYDEIVTYK